MEQTRSPRSLPRERKKLRNCPKQAKVKEKATSELGESLEGLPAKEDVSLSSNFEGKVAMKIMKLGPMRLKLREASELAESSTRLPFMGEVHSEHFDSVLHSNLLTWQKRRGPFERLWAKRSQVL
ncbi:hypothetical protein Goshw_009846 [Gossypium schwendimanii]|uniref:Uncharacterized protein n=1 Tax=Gossypium schwendimanii TaxID=34291 RepID=A0A7J9L9R6_GOSSC|nr:hypothetical protein [Gossypium schwendimanii]